MELLNGNFGFVNFLEGSFGANGPGVGLATGKERDGEGSRISGERVWTGSDGRRIAGGAGGSGGNSEVGESLSRSVGPAKVETFAVLAGRLRGASALGGPRPLVSGDLRLSGREGGGGRPGLPVGAEGRSGNEGVSGKERCGKFSPFGRSPLGGACWGVEG